MRLFLTRPAPPPPPRPAPLQLAAPAPVVARPTPIPIALDRPICPANRAYRVTMAGMQVYWAARNRDRARYLCARAARDAGWGTTRELLLGSRCVRCAELDMVAQQQEEGGLR